MASLTLIEEYMRRRETTDFIMPIWLPFIPIAMIVADVIFFLTFFTAFTITPHNQSLHLQYYDYEPEQSLAVLGGLLVFFALLILSLVLNVYVIYKWISRRNDHFLRQKLLFSAIISYLNSRIYDSEIENLNSILREMELDETEKSAVLWTILQFVPYIGLIVMFYVYHFLNKDFWKHEFRERKFLGILSNVLSKYGVDFYVPKMVTPRRSTALYIILTFITLGFFGFYWVYTLTKDPNEHFRCHRRWEDDLLMALKSI
jgi:hypothetical protein